MTSEVKKKISCSLKNTYRNNPESKPIGNRNPMYGKKHSEETRKKMSGLFSQERNPFYGHNHSDESRKKISESRIGNKNPGANKKWIVKDTESKRVLESDLQSYLDAGWKLGRYVSCETRMKHRENVKNRRNKNGRFK